MPICGRQRKAENGRHVVVLGHVCSPRHAAWSSPLSACPKPVQCPALQTMSGQVAEVGGRWDYAGEGKASKARMPIQRGERRDAFAAGFRLGYMVTAEALAAQALPGRQ